jgi:hypothetical protein
VTCVEINKLDSHVASASVCGDVLVHRLDTQQAVASLAARRQRQAITQIQVQPSHVSDTTGAVGIDADAMATVVFAFPLSVACHCK